MKTTMLSKGISTTYRIVLTCWDNPAQKRFSATYVDFVAAGYSNRSDAENELRRRICAEARDLNEPSVFNVELNGKHAGLLKKRVGNLYRPVTAYDIFEVRQMESEFPWWIYREFNIVSDGIGSKYVIEKNNKQLSIAISLSDALYFIDKHILETTQPEPMEGNHCFNILH